MERYMNPYTDFAFMRLFGKEANKQFLIDFLNALLEGEQKIRDITYLDRELLFDAPAHRAEVIDLLGESESGERFVIELLRLEQEEFQNLGMLYPAYPLRPTAIQYLEDDFNTLAAYTIALLSFQINDKPEYRHDVKLVDMDTGKVFNDQLAYIYLEMPKFKVQEAKLASRLEEWIYVLNNMHGLKELPERFEKEMIFKQLFHEASVSLLSQEERTAYEKSLRGLIGHEQRGQHGEEGGEV